MDFLWRRVDTCSQSVSQVIQCVRQSIHVALLATRTVCAFPSLLLLAVQWEKKEGRCFTDGVRDVVAPKGMLPFSTDWFMTWEQNVHASMFCNAWQFLLKTGLCNGVDAVIKAYRLYLEQCPQAEEGPLLALTRAWTLVRFVESGLLQLSSCNCCGGNFITHAHQPVGSFACSLCQPPSRAVKRRKLSQNPADIIPQLLDEQRVQAV